jgi:hypothetical protein
VIWILAGAAALGAGWFAARTLTAGAFPGPRWASLAVEISLGALFGPGLASVLYLGLAMAGAAKTLGVLAMLCALVSASAALWWKFTPRFVADDAAASRRSGAPSKEPPWTWALWICVTAGLIIFLLDFQAASTANPNGDWDAIAIWNLRAKYLASGGHLWKRAFSAEIGGHMIGAAHPGYPLFLSGFLALEWTAQGAPDAAVPIAASLLFSLAAFTLLGGSIAARRSPALGVLACLVLLASEVFASQTAAQYSDLLQGLAFLATLVLLEAADAQPSARLWIAVGLGAGLSAWIKNEGSPFAVAALAVALWRFRARAAPWLAAGAAPGLLALVILKLSLAQGREAMFPQTWGEMAAKIGDAGRWWQAALGFGKAVFDAGAAWTHPVLLAAILGFALRFVSKRERRTRAWLAIPIAVATAAEYGIYLITEANLDWHISTSVDRLVAQLWPSLIWFFSLMLRAPEEHVEDGHAAQIPGPRRA